MRKSFASPTDAISIMVLNKSAIDSCKKIFTFFHHKNTQNSNKTILIFSNKNY